MRIDFDDDRPHPDPLEGAISRREGFLFSIILHLIFLIIVLTFPELPFVKAAAERAAAVAETQRLAALEKRREQSRFVFVRPRVDVPALTAPDGAELSDRDRVARAPERSLKPENTLPFSDGNSAERVEVEDTSDYRDRESLNEKFESQSNEKTKDSEKRIDSLDQHLSRESDLTRLSRESDQRIRSRAEGLRDSLRNLDRFVQKETFGNTGGSAGAFGPAIQFDTKGVEFGPWIRRFIAQIKRNWLVPYAAMVMKGHTVITFNVHRDGAMSDLSVFKPASVESFNAAAFNALVASNPTQALPPEYPDDRAHFTVTFYYNERPPSR